MNSKIYQTTLIIVLISFISLFAQTQEQKIFQVEKTTISAGGEYSIMLQKAINSGTADKFMVSKIQKDRNSFLTDAITPLLGVDFNSDATLTGYYHIPPDPIGVAGPSHLVAVNNTSIWWANKDGSSAVNMRLGKNATTIVGSFFENLSPVNGTFDPKVIYDQYNDRFVVVTLERVENSTDLVDAANTSRILVAVSATSDPNGAWYYKAINSKINFSGIEAWADYPGFSVGTNAVYITANLFTYNNGSNQGSRLWIMEKGEGSAGFYDGGLVSVNVYDHFNGAGLTWKLTTQPAHMFGTPVSSTLGTFLFSTGLSLGSDDYLCIIQVDNPLNPATILFENTYINLGDIHNTDVPMPDAPQMIAETDKLINTNDSRAMHAVWRNNVLWATNTVTPPSDIDAGQATAHWYKINTSVGISLSDQGNIGGEDIAAGTYTFMPSIAVNNDDEMVVGFAASAPTIYPGAYYAGRIPTDAAGTTPHTGTLKAGEDFYYRAFGGTRNRWGDYSGMSVDPSDDKTFWIFNQYAKTRGTILGSYPTEDGRWATTFGKIVDAPLPVELTTFSAKEIKNKIILNWQTATEVNNYGFEIERASTSLSMIQNEESSSQAETVEWKTISFVEGHGNSNSPKDYMFYDSESPNGIVKYRLKQIDTDGTFEYSEEIEIQVESAIENKLVGNYPNPFNPTTIIRFDLAKEGNVAIVVYNVIGEVIKKLVDQKMIAGRHKIEFDASRLSSGIYFYQINAGNFVDVKKMMVIK